MKEIRKGGTQVVRNEHPSRMTDPVPFPIQGDGRQTRSFVYIDDFTDEMSWASLPTN